MLTPPRYWRVAKTIAELQNGPPNVVELPTCLREQTAPPTTGDGVLFADYDRETQTGLIRYIGIIQGRDGTGARVDWRPTMTEIWVDTPTGRGNWTSKDGFKFAATKVAGYGLHHLFAETFPGLEPRQTLPSGATAVRVPRERRVVVPRERLQPVEVVGEPSSATRGGYVYVLQSAYGFKVGRTRNVPNRMRAFGVHLPIMYTIPLCAWFDDHIEAEFRYHRLFADKRVNGEWFDLADQDIELIRRRAFGPGGK